MPACPGWGDVTESNEQGTADEVNYFCSYSHLPSSYPTFVCWQLPKCSIVLNQATALTSSPLPFGSQILRLYSTAVHATLPSGSMLGIAST